MHGLKQLPFKDRLVSPLMGRPAINDFADVKAVLEQMSESAGPKTDAAPDPAADKPTRLRAETTPVEVLDQGANGAKLKIAGKEDANRSRFLRDQDNLLVGDPVTQRHRSANPDPLALGGGDLVPYPLADDLALELSEG